MKKHVLVFVVALGLVMGHGHTFAAELTLLGSLPDLPRSGATDISADGRVVVGYSLQRGSGFRWGEDRVKAFRWTREQGLQDLGTLDDHRSSWAHAVSADGNKIVGESWPENSWPLGEAFLWSNDDMVGLGDLPGAIFGSTARDISADGTTVVGYSYENDTPDGAYPQAFWWREESGMRPVGFGPIENVRSSHAVSISEDGDLIAGFSNQSGRSENGWVFDVSENEFVGDLGDVPLQGQYLFRPTISADGTTVVGRTSVPDGIHPFTWSASDGKEILSNLSGGAATTVSHDGKLIFGALPSFMWHEALGARNLRSTLEKQHGLGEELDSWSDILVSAITNDQMTIAGTLVRGSRSQAFVAALDRPIHWIGGDTDLDFDVDFEDFLRLAEHFGGPGSWEHGDFDISGSVDFTDFLILSDAFGTQPVTGEAASVPEPTSSALVMLSLVAFGLLQMRTKRAVNR